MFKLLQNMQKTKQWLASSCPKIMNMRMLKRHGNSVPIKTATRQGCNKTPLRKIQDIVKVLLYKMREV